MDYCELTPEQRSQNHFDRKPCPGQSFPYDPAFCELPPGLMFMHDAVFAEGEIPESVDVWWPAPVKASEQEEREEERLRKALAALAVPVAPRKLSKRERKKEWMKNMSRGSTNPSKKSSGS